MHVCSRSFLGGYPRRNDTPTNPLSSSYSGDHANESPQSTVFTS
uniref:Uncharacterized protein n=1 Tax=Anguilla anguilla TaxID=7936 RepID=A0A0E9TI82_ANGAN